MSGTGLNFRARAPKFERESARECACVCGAAQIVARCDASCNLALARIVVRFLSNAKFHGHSAIIGRDRTCLLFFFFSSISALVKKKIECVLWIRKETDMLWRAEKIIFSPGSISVFFQAGSVMKYIDNNLPRLFRSQTREKRSLSLFHRSMDHSVTQEGAGYCYIL